MAGFGQATTGVAMEGGIPCFWPRAERLNGPETLAMPTGETQQAEPSATVPPWHFLFGLIQIFQIMFKHFEKCSNSNKFNKNINSILLFEFKHIL
jgi:hypothetical protein